MTKRLTTMLASVVGAFAFVVVPASNAAIHEHSTEAILQVTLLTLSNPNLSVFTSTSDFLEMLTLNEIADGGNVLDEMPSMNPLPPLFTVRQVTAQTGWVLSGFVDGETWVRAHITFVNSSSEWIAATILVDATVRAEYINPYLFGPDKALSELDCSDPTDDS